MIGCFCFQRVGMEMCSSDSWHLALYLCTVWILGCQAILPFLLAGPALGMAIGVTGGAGVHLTGYRNPIYLLLCSPLLCQPVFTVCMCVFVGVIHPRLPLDHHLFLFSPSPQHFNTPWSKPILYYPPSPATNLSLSSPQDQTFQ